MSRLLYLDTARLGQMSPTAFKTHCDFVRLMAEDPSSPYTEQFLLDGATASPEIAQRFPELARWHGIEGLKQQLRNAFAANTDSNTEVLLASRTTSLMQMSIRSLLTNGQRHLLLTDLTWPPYRKWIQRYANRNGIKLSMLPLRQSIWQRGFTADDVATVILGHVRKTQADSLFLPAVTHTGIRLPLPTILKATYSEPFQVHTIIDASQAYGHIDTTDWTHLADFTFGGCHKWVRAYLPLGVAFAREPQPFSRHRGHAPDPLTQFCDTSQAGQGLMETVNLTPLITANGAVLDLSATMAACHSPATLCDFETLIDGRSTLRTAERHHALASNILLLQPSDLSWRNLSPQHLRGGLAGNGVAVTTYRGGRIRLSLLQANSHSLKRTANQLVAALRRIMTTKMPKARPLPV